MKKRMIMLWILKKCKKRIPAIITMVLADMGNAFFSVIFAIGSRRVIDSAVSGSMDAFKSACFKQLLIILAILFCVTTYRYLHDKLTDDLDRDWKQQIFKKLLRGDYSKVTSFHTGELLNRMNNDVATMNAGLLTAIPTLASMVVRLLSAMLVLISIAPGFTALIFGAGILAVAVTSLMRNGLKSLYKKVSMCNGRVLSFIQEALEKLLVVQAMNLSNEVERRSDGHLEERYKIQRKRRHVSLFANTSVSILYHFAGFFTLIWCSGGLITGALTFGTMTAMTQLVNQIQSPFVNLSGFVPKYAAMTASAERLMELDDIEDDNCDGVKLERDAQVSAIGADSVSFAYDKDLVLENATFSLPNDAFVAITGASGIGKSTILKLMLGIFKPNAGYLYAECNGEKVKLSKNSRDIFAYVPQGNFLFSGTLRENILIGNPEANDEIIDQAVYVSAMDEYLVALPDGLETVIGENGAGLSEGQAQRLAIARAIASGAPILLLDEITSALDGPTEETVLKRIAELNDRMCIVVTHRPAALALANYNLEVANKTIKVKKL